MTECRCYYGHSTRRREDREWILPCGCVIDITSERSRSAMAAAGVDPDEYEVGEDGISVHKQRGYPL